MVCESCDGAIHVIPSCQDHGAIWFRTFESTKQPDGFREFYEALELNPCLDPIHTSGLRAMEEKKHAVYEAVNKPSLAGHFVGLHNESTFVKTATFKEVYVCLRHFFCSSTDFSVNVPRFSDATCDGMRLVAKSSAISTSIYIIR